jgi:hypothetical protein
MNTPGLFTFQQIVPLVLIIIVGLLLQLSKTPPPSMHFLLKRSSHSRFALSRDHFPAMTATTVAQTANMREEEGGGCCCLFRSDVSKLVFEKKNPSKLAWPVTSMWLEAHKERSWRSPLDPFSS